MSHLPRRTAHERYMDNTSALTPSALAELARDSFLERYAGGTLALYELDLRFWFDWCAKQGLDPVAARRPHIEAFGRWLMADGKNSARSATRRLQTIRSFFKLAVADEILDRDPTLMVRMPRWHVDRSTIAYLDPHQVGRLLRAAQETSPAHHALIALMAMLGLRVSEACGVMLEDLEEDALGYVVLTARRKGGKVSRMPVPVPLMRIVSAARGDRTEGPLILTRAGKQQNRRGAYDWFKRVALRAGLPGDSHPHTLRHASISALVDAGVPMHEAQEFAGHADIRQTAHYYHRPQTLDQHGAHVTARLFASAS